MRAMRLKGDLPKLDPADLDTAGEEMERFLRFQEAYLAGKRAGREEVIASPAYPVIIGGEPPEDPLPGTLTVTPILPPPQPPFVPGGTSTGGFVPVTTTAQPLGPVTGGTVNMNAGGRLRDYATGVDWARARDILSVNYARLMT